MNIFKKYFENDVKLNANEIAIVNDNNKGQSLDYYLKNKANLGVMTMYFTEYKSTGYLAVPLMKKLNSFGNGLIETSAGIKIGDGIKNIMVEGFAFSNSGTAAGHGALIGILKNGTLIDKPIPFSSWVSVEGTNGNITLTLPRFLLSVEKGDVIAMGVAVNGSTSAIFPRGTITVEVVS